uniref:Uncharacterized protein n=1 Tax=Oryza meridionalis TaxID=40149 RepID=A0A0E0D7P0_9ORYZ
MDPLQPCLETEGGRDIAALTSSKSWVTPQGRILVRDTAAATTFLQQNPHGSVLLRGVVLGG